MLVLFGSINRAAADEPITVEFVKPGNAAQVRVAVEVVEIDLHSESGIGKATLTRTGEAWPQSLVLRLHLRGLEMFRVSGGKHTLSTAVSSHAASEQHGSRETAEGSVELKPDSPLWLQIRRLDTNGKPRNANPLADGYFEITLPGALWEANPKSLSVEWIDFYRD